jgi:hypothetical protein
MTYQPLGERTTHFTFQYDDMYPDSLEDLRVVFGIAEDNLAQLADWFGLSVPDSFGPIDVRTNRPSYSGASNGGYLGASTGINLACEIRLRRPAAVVDDVMGMLFVAELAEVLMSYRNATVPGAGPWNAADSAGEGLSQVLARDLHPIGFWNYYQDHAAQSWVNAGSPNFVDTSLPRDSDWPSFGCAVVFLYYLHTQLGHGWRQIITATGSTLQQKYAALGHGDSGFDAMVRVLEWRYPPLSTLPMIPDDPFPIDMPTVPHQQNYRPPPYLEDYRPDPPPEARLLLQALAAVQVAAAHVRAAHPQRAEEVLTWAGRQYNVPAEFLEPQSRA